MASQSRTREAQAHPDLQRVSEPPRDSCLSNVTTDSRPPSYFTVSLNDQIADESARKARAIRDAETDLKSIVSDGDRESVDVTQEKMLAPVTERKEPLEPNGEEEEEEEDDEFVDARSGDSTPNSDILRAIRELQRQQEHLLVMHENHNKQLEDLIRQKPAVNNQFKKIRNSMKRRSNSPRSNSRSNDATAQEVDSSNAIRTTTTTTDNGNHSKGNRNHDNNYENASSKVTEDASAPSDQVIPRKPSKHSNRTECTADSYRKLVFREENQKVETQEKQKVYVQLEKVYTNFQRLHLLPDTIRKLMGGHFMDTEESSGTNLFAARSGSDNNKNNNNNNNNNQMLEIQRENETLKMRNAELQEELAKIRKEKEAILARRRSPPPLPPKPEIRPQVARSGARGRPRWKAERNGSMQENPPLTAEVSPTFVAGRPTSPTVQRVRPLDIDIREISVQHRIEDYSQKLYQEKIFKEYKQVSSPFYTTHGGCRAQLEVFLNGNGTGRNRCMSLFIRVVPGEYDNFITWPINLHIRATLMNQQRGLSHSVEDNGNQFQFSRPQGFSDSNDCWGLVEFVDHHLIYKPGFIKEDAILLRCKIRLLS